MEKIKTYYELSQWHTKVQNSPNLPNIALAWNKLGDAAHAASEAAKEMQMEMGGIFNKSKMRNPSKNTIKRLLRPCNNREVGWGFRQSNYFLFNEVGARVYVISKGKICNREGKGALKYISVKVKKLKQ